MQKTTIRQSVMNSGRLMNPVQAGVVVRGGDWVMVDTLNLSRRTVSRKVRVKRFPACRLGFEACDPLSENTVCNGKLE
jgi:hypothetical protein